MNPTPTVEIINALPNIENKRYLELGVDAGWTYDHVLCKDKTGVEITDGKGPATHIMSTEDFLRNHANGPYDVVYIDACHEVMHVMRDFNWSTEYLAESSVVLVHDLGPASEKECAEPNISCGNGYKFLVAMFQKMVPNKHVFTCTSNHGLTMFINPRRWWVTPQELDHITYNDLVKLNNSRKRYTQEEMVLKAANIRDMLPQW